MKATALEVFFDLCLFVILFFVVRHGLKYRTHNQWCYILCLLFCLFSFWGGDYFHYKAMYEDFSIFGSSGAVEKVYFHIIKFSSTYLSFRLIVWGSSITLSFWCAKRLKLNSQLFNYTFVAFALLSFSYARVSLAIAIICLGYTFIVKPFRLNLLSIILGLIIIYVGTLFHKSIILLAVIALVSVLNITKLRICLMVLGFPIAIILANIYLPHLLSDDTILSAEQVAKAQAYLSESHEKTRGIGALINFTIQYASVYLACLFIVIQYFRKYRLFSTLSKQVILFVLLTVYAGSIFLCIPMGFVMFYRIVSMAKLPLVFALTLNYNYLTKIQIWLVVALAYFSDFYQLSYSFYLTFFT